MWGQGVVVVWMTTGCICVLGNLAQETAYWLEKPKELGERPRFFPTGEDLESRLSYCVAVHSPLKSPLYWSKLCFSSPLRLQELASRN